MHGVSSVYQIFSRSFAQGDDGNRICQINVPADQVATYRAFEGVEYGSLYIMPIGKSIKSIDWGDIKLNLKQNANGSVEEFNVMDYNYDHNYACVLPALSDYIEIPESLTTINFCSGNINYYTPYRGGYSLWYLVEFDENKQVLGSEKCFSRGVPEPKTITLPEGTKYIRFNFLWQTLDISTLQPYDKWPKYAFIKNPTTQEIIWPKVTYSS